MLVALPVAGIATGYAHVGGYPFAPIRYDKTACPQCETNRVTVLPEPYRWLKEHAPGEALAELPLGLGPMPLPGEPAPEAHDPYYLIFYALDAIPRINGVTSFFPPDYHRLQASLEAFPAPAAIEALRSRGARWVLVHGNRYDDDDWQALAARLDPPPSGLRLERKWGSVWLFAVE